MALNLVGVMTEPQRLEIERALFRRDLPRMHTALVACVDDARLDTEPYIDYIRWRPAMFATLLTAAIHNANHYLSEEESQQKQQDDAMQVLEYVAARYALTHPPGSEMLLRRIEQDEQTGEYDTVVTQTPLDVVQGIFTHHSAPMVLALLDRGLLTSTPATVRPRHESLLLRALQCMHLTTLGPELVARLLREGFRLHDNNNGVEDARAIEGCLWLRQTDEAGIAALRLLLPVYAGRMTRLSTDAESVRLIVRMLRSFTPAAAAVVEALDVLRALGLRVTPYVREQLGEIDGLLDALDASDTRRVRRTVEARRAMSQLPDDIRDRVALQASGGQSYSNQLVVVPPEVRLAHHEAAAAADADA